LAAQKDQFMVYAQENGNAVLAIVLLGSTVALAYNVTHNLLLQRTSSVAVCASQPFSQQKCSISRL
jgi:predicted negative regulator of RcsB-dependent stress response